MNKKVKLNIYYTPTKLTENSLVFNKKAMTEWWQQGYEYAEKKEMEKKAAKSSWFKLGF